MCFLRQCCTHSLCPTLWPLCPKTGSVLAMQPLCRSHGWTVVNHYYTQNWGLTMCFLRQCCTHSLCPTLWSQCSKTGSVLAMQPLCRSHGWTVVNHYYTQNWGLTMCFLRQCCTHSLCPTLWPLCPKTGSVLAMQPLCRSHGWTVVNHYCTQNWGLTMCFLRQCCTHSLCPTLWPQCSKTGSVLAMQPLCRSHGWTVVNHYCTQNWGLTMCFLRQCCTHCLCPTLWPLCPKTGSVLAMQPLCRSHDWTVVNHYYTQNWGLTMCFLRQCCTHCLCPTLWPLCPKTGSVLAMQPLCRSHGWTVVNHYYTQNWGLTMCFLRQCCTHSLCPTLWSQCSKTGSVLAMQPLCRSHDWTVVNHYCTQNWGLTSVFFAAMLHSLFVPHIVATVPQNWLGLGHAAFVQKSWLDCGKSLLHTKLGSHHVFFAAMLHSQFVPHIVATMLQNWLGLGHAAFVQKSWLDCGKSLLHTKLGSHHVFFAAMLHSQFVPHIVATVPQTGSVLAMQPLCRSHGWTVVNHYYTQNWGLYVFCGNVHSQFVLVTGNAALTCLCPSCGGTHSLCPMATVPQNWLGLGHAAFVQKSWLDCGKSLLHTTGVSLGSAPCVFCGNAALTVCAWLDIVANHYCTQNWLGLGHAAFVQSWLELWQCTQNWTVAMQLLHKGCMAKKSWLDCGKSLLHTQNWGLTTCAIFAAMLHSQFVPHIVATVPQNWLGLGHAAFVQKSWLDCGKALLHTKLGSQFCAMQPLCRSAWLDCGKSLFLPHTKLGPHHVLFAAMLHSHVCAPHCGHIIITHKTGVSPCVFCGNAADFVHQCLPKLARSWPCSLCAEVMVGLW